MEPEGAAGERYRGRQRRLSSTLHRRAGWDASAMAGTASRTRICNSLRVGIACHSVQGGDQQRKLGVFSCTLYVISSSY